MRILLGSGGFRTPERIEFLQTQMRAFFGSIRTLLFIPYALRDHDGYVRQMQIRGLDAGYDLVGIHTLPDPVRAVHEAQGVFVGGGNTFRLLEEMYRRGLIPALRERVRAGLPYLGVSAGCNVATPSIKTTNDMPILQPTSFEALGLVRFQVNPHYFSGQIWVRQERNLVEHYGETRDERIAEFHQVNSTPVVGLTEGATLWCEKGQIRLFGGMARVFRQGQDAVDVRPEADLAMILPS